MAREHGNDWNIYIDSDALEQSLANIHITIGERNSGFCETAHLISDYPLSRKIARFGLKVQTVVDLCGHLAWRGPGGVPISPFLFHKYAISNQQKVRRCLPF